MNKRTKKQDEEEFLDATFDEWSEEINIDDTDDEDLDDKLISATYLESIRTGRKIIQKTRIQFSNRLSAMMSGRSSFDQKAFDRYSFYVTKFEEIEKALTEDLAEEAKDIPVIQEMVKIKGISWIMAARVYAEVDIKKADTVSALWRYAGYGVVDGLRERPVKGEKLHYNKDLKTACYLVGSCFLKSRSPYRSIYDSSKEYYQINRPTWTKAHIHKAAMRKMVKVWLHHLWLTWRKLEGLPTRNLYVEQYLGHKNILQPSEFGWTEIGVEDE